MSGDDRPNNARMVDYVLGGSHHFAIDRQATDAVRCLFPEGTELVRAQRRFLQRAVSWMIEERGIRCFLDFGTGLPTNGNVHEVVFDGVDGEQARVVYTDIDPISVAYSRNLLRDLPQVWYLQADIADPDTLLDRPEVDALRAGEMPVGITLIGIGMYFTTEAIATILRKLHHWAPAGSALALVLSNPATADHPGMRAYQERGFPMYWQTTEEIHLLLGDWRLTDDGLVHGLGWRFENDSRIPGAHMNWTMVAIR